MILWGNEGRYVFSFSEAVRHRIKIKVAAFFCQLLDPRRTRHVAMRSKHMLTKERCVTHKVKELGRKGRVHIGENFAPKELNQLFMNAEAESPPLVGLAEQAVYDGGLVASELRKALRSI